MPKILIVEDIDEIRENACELLELNGFDVITAHNGAVALEMLTSCEVDLILSDIIMPDMDGFEFLDNLRKDPKVKDIPFIYMSASVQEKEKQMAFEKGISGFIHKPFFEEEMLDAIQKALEKS